MTFFSFLLFLHMLFFSIKTNHLFATFAIKWNSCRTILRNRCEQGTHNKGQFRYYQMFDTVICGRFRWSCLLAHRPRWSVLSEQRLWFVSSQRLKHYRCHFWLARLIRSIGVYKLFGWIFIPFHLNHPKYNSQLGYCNADIIAKLS